MSDTLLRFHGGADLKAAISFPFSEVWMPSYLESLEGGGWRRAVIPLILGDSHCA